MTNRVQSNPTYRTWKCMLRRCYSPSAIANSSYQGKGISVCARWRESFDNFVQDMGERSDGYTIDRIDDDGNYEPGNCKWSTYKEQNNGKSHPRVMLITIDGETNNLKEWCRRFGLKYTTVYARLKNGWPQTKALELHKRLEEYPMTESRVEAVAAPIIHILKGCGLTNGIAEELGLKVATDAIEANDAWFQTHGWKAVPREHPRGEDRLDLAQAIMADQEMRTWQRLYDLAPSPEEVDR